MIRRQTALFATATLLGGLAAVTAALAQAPAPASPPPQGQEMMKGHDGMMGRMDPDHMKQMARMMENCNRMMERMNEDKPGSPDGSPPARRS
ncbi:hypothetical protein FHP25_04960 [Vineibacter terrae]|uniref:DUF4175 domain-containing protein n=2 Tax=Vineibacter terrae TaxID=2586908 RepID=A0A5C8PSX3_9HYPH|nr:hypothetical protein FHP25_04960 [Vineibacter terrae]